MARKTLSTLIRLNRFEVDEKRRALQRLLDRETEIQGSIDHLDRQLEAERAVAAQPEAASLGLSYGAFAAATKTRKEAHREKLADLYPEIEQARAALSEAFGILKKYEIAQANRLAEEAAEQARVETLEMDELGLASHRRNAEGKAGQEAAKRKARLKTPPKLGNSNGD
jgi:flagellar export protein FliJ